MAKKRTPRANDIQRWLGSTAIPLFVLDTERRVCLFNLACQELTGWTATEVVGQVCQYAGHPDVQSLDALTGSLCPPPEAFAGQELCVPAHVVHQGGTSQAHLLHFFPLRDDDGTQIGVLGVVKPHVVAASGHASTSPLHRLHAELAALRISMRNRFGSFALTCRSDAMRRVLAQVELAQHCAAPVSLAGEQGTGKEHAARVIHFGSASKSRWFIPVDCATLSPDELQQTFDRAYEESYQESSRPISLQPGTLYLGNVDRLPRDLQLLLIRLAMPEVSPARPLPRLMASSTKPLHDAVAAYQLRPDLLALVSTIAIELPPLRERGPDLRLLVQHFIEESNRHGTKQVTGLADEVWEQFEEYRWPGNLEELQEVVRDAIQHSTDYLIQLADLPFRFRTNLESQQLSPPINVRTLPLDPMLEKVERQLLLLALERCRFNKTKAAEMLGITRVRLYTRMHRLGIEDREARDDVRKPKIETPEISDASPQDAIDRFAGKDDA